MFSSVSVVLSLLGFNLPFISFLKIDFSETPAVLATFWGGSLCGILVVLIKNLVVLPFTRTVGIGEISNFILGCSLVLPAGIIFKKTQSIFLSSLGGILSSAFSSIIFNYFIIFPMYFAIVEKEAILSLYRVICPYIQNSLEAILVINLPLTIFKSTLSIIFATFIVKRIKIIRQY
jgi:riboflavin transporter FmnP